MGATLRILSANLWNGAADAEAFARLALGVGADVVAVQELGPEQADALAGAYPYGRLEPRDDHHGGGIALARPGDVHPLPLARRHAWRVELSTEAWPELAESLEIVNVHVFAPHAAGGLGLLRRRPQVRDLARHLEGAARARVVVGDFNATPLWPAYRRMGRLLEDAAVAVAQREGRRPKPTWGPRPWLPRLLRIDHAFVSRVAPERFEVLPVAGSDHSAVLVDVAVGEGRIR